jgi:hypothetical protein
MATKTRSGCHTFEDFCALVKDGQEADLIDGVIYMASPDNTAAADLFGWLFFILYGYVARKKLGRVFGSRVAFRLEDRQSPEPDISFLRTEYADRIEPGRVDGPPDLAIEIVSPESAERDYKRSASNISDPEYPNTGSSTRRKRRFCCCAGMHAGTIKKCNRSAANYTVKFYPVSTSIRNGFGRVHDPMLLQFFNNCSPSPPIRNC